MITNPLRYLRLSDLREAARITTDAAVGVTRITEGVHLSVLQKLGLTGGGVGRTRGLTGLVYSCVQGGILLAGKGLGTILSGLEASFERPGPETAERETFIAILNGVIGDRLRRESSCLATPMTLRFRGEELTRASAAGHHGSAGGDTDGVTSRVVLFIHGLCMNDLGWKPIDDTGADYGQVLLKSRGFTPVYLRYNTGLHIFENGANLGELLENLIEIWPVEIEELTVIAHSMGGLVIRSAIYQARGQRWTDILRKIIFLGTPHHGAPLEKIGNRLDVLLEVSSHTRPLSRIARLRSAGITDLRLGNLLRDDRAGSSEAGSDSRRHIPLPASVDCYAIAARTGKEPSRLADGLIGDGLVPLNSALGKHREAARTLKFQETSQFIAAGHNHIDLLSSREVAEKLIEWIR